MNTSLIGAIELFPLTEVGEIETGSALAQELLQALHRGGLQLVDGDVLVVSSKVVSKAEGLRVPESEGLDKQELVVQHSRRIVTERATATGVTRVVHASAGPVMAAAGIDASNTGPDGGLLLLPPDPDAAARDLHAALSAALAPEPLPRIGVILSDTSGRPWRAGQVDFALGASGMHVLDDLRGGFDADGRDLSVTSRAIADQVAAAADLVKGKSAGVPAALVRGLPSTYTQDPDAVGAAALVRAGPDDWFAFGQAEAVRSALGVDPGSEAAAEAGYPSLAPDDLESRVARAIAVALYDPAGHGGRHGHSLDAADEQPSVSVRHSPDGIAVIEVHEPDDYRAGRLVARLEVALHSEGLAGPLLNGPAAPVEVTRRQ